MAHSDLHFQGPAWSGHRETQGCYRAKRFPSECLIVGQQMGDRGHSQPLTDLPSPSETLTTVALGAGTALGGVVSMAEAPCLTKF